jgi:hypothetical protein
MRADGEFKLTHRGSSALSGLANADSSTLFFQFEMTQGDFT